MSLSVEQIAALIAETAMIFVYLYLFLFFYKAYTKMKATGFKNAFFQGFIYLFGILTLFYILYSLNQYLSYFTSFSFDIMDSFSYQPSSFSSDIIASVSHQVKPGYIFFYSLMNFVIASLVFPLEQAIGWKKTPFTKFMIFCGILELTLFIPALSFTYYAVIPIFIGFTGIIFGIFLNIGVNIKLFIQSPGAIRTRSLFAIIAFFAMAFGLTLSLEVGWLSSFGINYNGETIIGCIIQVFAAIFYRQGFKNDQGSEQKTG